MLLCSRHNVELVLEQVPVWMGCGTDDNPHRIDHWVPYMRCPVPNCGYARAAKNPNGGRTLNRKTLRTVASR